jgi:D-alanyl-D-alanine carboxypeptidase
MLLFVPLARAGQLVGTVSLEWGLEPQVRVIAQDSAYAVLSADQETQLDRRVELPREHAAPVDAGEPLGRMEFTLGDSLIAQVDLVAARGVERMTLWEKVLSLF